MSIKTPSPSPMPVRRGTQRSSSWGGLGHASVTLTGLAANSSRKPDSWSFKANRDGVAGRFPDPAVQRSIDVDLTLINSYDRLLTNLKLDLVQRAKALDPQTISRLRT